MSAEPVWRLVRAGTLPSTSDACIAAARRGEAAGLAVQAAAQSRPRASRGRSWSGAPGALAMSVLLPHEAGVLWPFLAGIALHEALCVERAHDAAIRLKWPNDVMLQGRKLGGILVESSPPLDARDGSGWVVIGFGANLAQAPLLAERQAACLAELIDPAPGADRLAGRLLDRLAHWHRLRHQPARIRAAWLARAHPAGTMLAVRTGDGPTSGAFSSIAEDGTLLLDVGGAIRRVTTGDVQFCQGA